MGGFGLGNEVENSSSFSFFLSSFHAYSVHLGQGRTGRMPSLAAVSPPPLVFQVYIPCLFASVDVGFLLSLLLFTS